MSKVTTNELKKSQKEMITVRWLSVCVREYTLSLVWRIDIVDGTEMDCGPYAYRTQKLLFFFPFILLLQLGGHVDDVLACSQL